MVQDAKSLPRERCGESAGGLTRRERLERDVDPDWRRTGNCWSLALGRTWAVPTAHAPNVLLVSPGHAGQREITTPICDNQIFDNDPAPYRNSPARLPLTQE